MNFIKDITFTLLNVMPKALKLTGFGQAEADCPNCDSLLHYSHFMLSVFISCDNVLDFYFPAECEKTSRSILVCVIPFWVAKNQSVNLLYKCRCNLSESLFFSDVFVDMS